MSQSFDWLNTDRLETRPWICTNPDYNPLARLIWLAGIGIGRKSSCRPVFTWDKVYSCCHRRLIMMLSDWGLETDWGALIGVHESGSRGFVPGRSKGEDWPC